jgi:hypothetical protein
MNPAVEYLESDEYLDNARSGRFTPEMHHSTFPEATTMTCSGVTAVRPMFELIEDHESLNLEGKCRLCEAGQMTMRVVAIVDEQRGVLSGLRAT